MSADEQAQAAADWPNPTVIREEDDPDAADTHAPPFPGGNHP